MTTIYDINHLENQLTDIGAGLYGTPQDAAEAAITVYKAAGQALKAETADLEAIQRRAKGIIADIMLELQTDAINTSAGKAYVPAAGVTVTYDAKALDALSASSPELKAMLWPHRQERERPGSLTIR